MHHAKRYLAAAAASLVVLTGVTLAGSPSPALAASRCGLSNTSYSGGGPAPRAYHYTIRNCHRFTVKRKIVVKRGRDGYCHTIRPRSEVRGLVTLFGVAPKVEGMRPC